MEWNADKMRAAAFADFNFAFACWASMPDLGEQALPRALAAPSRFQL